MRSFIVGAIAVLLALPLQAQRVQEQMLVSPDWLQRRLGMVTVLHIGDAASYEARHIPGAVLIPKGEFLNGNALSQLPSDKQVVMHCKSGVRSAETLAIVKGAGYDNAVHVGGGVVAWVNQIDPSQPAY